MIKVPRQVVKVKNQARFAVAVLSMAQLTAVSMPAHAEWREQIGAFRVGIATSNGQPFNPSQIREFKSVISQALKMPVEVTQTRNAASLIDAAASDRVEYAVLSALGFATLDLTCGCMEPIAAPVSEEGATHIRSVLYVNAGSVENLKDLVGKRIAIGPESSLTATVLPMAQFQIDGVALEALDIELVTKPTIEEALNAVAEGSVDGFFGWDQMKFGSGARIETALSRKLETYQDLQMEEIWHSEPVRFGPHSVRSDLPDEAKQALKEALLELEQSAPRAYDFISPNLAGGLEPVTKADYAPIISALRKFTSREGKASEQ